MKEKYTLFQWCRMNKMEFINLDNFQTKEQLDVFYNELVSKFDFDICCSLFGVNTDVLIKKPKERIEHRMYGMVPYNLSPIQQGIQFAHALVEYREKIDTNIQLEEYKTWANRDKTVIILNGGTTNNNRRDKFYGTLNQALDSVQGFGYSAVPFYEPDLNDALSAFVFLVDERVYDSVTYNYEEENIDEIGFYQEFREFLLKYRLA